MLRGMSIDPRPAPRPRRVLVTGATGFVGRHLAVALEAAGHHVLHGTRHPEIHRARHPERTWVEVDVEAPHTLDAALAGVDVLYFLVHAMGGGRGYAAREEAAARDVASAAARARVERLVYLGGVAPAGKPSRHLASRLRTGEVLRAGTVPALELRAAMVIGEGSTSWRMVRDLAARLPAMVLPRWLGNRSSPVLVDDVVWALLAALDLPLAGAAVYDLPGPEAVRHRDLLARLARRLGHRPVMIGVPILTPRLSSYWIGLVTDVDLALAQELVAGLVTDLVPEDDRIWGLAGSHAPATLDVAIDTALADAQSPAGAPSADGLPRSAHQRMVALGQARAVSATP